MKRKIFLTPCFLFLASVLFAIWGTEAFGDKASTKCVPDLTLPLPRFGRCAFGFAVPCETTINVDGENRVVYGRCLDQRFGDPSIKYCHTAVPTLN